MIAAPAASASSNPIAHIAIIPRVTRVAHTAVTHHGSSKAHHRRAKAHHRRAKAHHRRAKAHKASSCPGAHTPAIAASDKLLRKAVVCLINVQRANHHLPRLHGNPRLDRSAQRWTNAMVARRDFTHGSNFSARITAVGFVWSAAAENIATGYPTAAAVVRGWMGSTGHCQNILGPMYLDVGTGISRHPVRGYASGAATWTQDFGLPMGHGRPSGNFGPASGCPY